MNILDIIIIIFLLLGFVTGFKRGLVKQAVITFGAILTLVLAFIFKNSLSIYMYKHLPFYTIGLLKNYSSLNILLYELVSFFVLLSLFSLIYAVIVKISGVVEKIVRATIILALPSKIFGGLLGIIENYVACFILLLIASMPIFAVSTSKVMTESKIRPKILKNTIVFSSLSKGLVKSIDSINDLIINRNNYTIDQFNCKTLNVLYKNKIVSKDSIDYLKDNNKIDNSCKMK